MPYVWTKWCPPRDEALWEARLRHPADLVITRRPNRKRSRLELYFVSKRQAEGMRAHFGGSVRKLETRNWAATSASDPILVKVRDRLIVTSERSREALTELAHMYRGRRLLQIPVESAFGTGDHATTATCLRLLADFARKRTATRWRLLDIGTGSGILAIAARLLGAGTAEGFDSDPSTMAIARRNVRANGYADTEIAIYKDDVFFWNPRTPRWDVITANLYSEVLKPAFPKMRRALRPQGRAIVSGMLLSQADDTLAAAVACGFKIDKRIRRGKWATAQLA